MGLGYGLEQKVLPYKPDFLHYSLSEKLWNILLSFIQF